MIAWFTRHPIAANLLMFALLVGGVLSASHMRKEIIPKLPSNTITISVAYDGRTAQQVDNEIAQKVDQALQGVAGIKHIKSQSTQHMLNVTISKKLDYSMERLFSDVKARVESIYDWPQQAERPIIIREQATYAALMVQIYGETDTDSLVKTAQHVKRQLLASPAIHKVEEHSPSGYAIYINVTPDKMRQYGLTFDDIAQSIGQQSVRSKSGLLRTPNGQFLIFSEQHAQHQRQLASLVVKTTEQGSNILLSDVAEIDDSFIEHDAKFLFNNQQTIALEVKMAANSDVLEISEATRKIVANLKKTLPNNIELLTWFDASTYVKQRLDLLENNALMGFILVFIILTLFLHLKLAFWVAMGLPVAIAGTFIVLGELGFNFTINEVTTFGFILVLGILVDDAVVVGESIYATKKRLGNTIDATISGAHKVALPTIFGVLTTIVALLPMTRFPSEAGRLFAGFAWVVIVALLFSLVESKFILPAHLRHIKVEQQQVKEEQSRLLQWWHRFRSWPEKSLDWLNERLYQPTLSLCIRYRYAWLVAFIALSIAVLGALYQGKVRTALFPDVPGDLLVMSVELNNNAPLALTTDVMEAIENTRQNINQSFIARQMVEEDVIAKSLSIMYEEGAVLVFAELLEKAQRPNVSLKAIAQQWRQAIEPLSGVTSVEVTITESGTSQGTQIIFQHPDTTVLAKIVTDASNWLKQQGGVRNVKDTGNKTIPQLEFTLKPEAKRYNITQHMLSSQIAAAYGGLEVDRFYRNEQRVKVYITLPREHRDARADLSDMRIFNAQNQGFPLLSVADVKPVVVDNSINRLDGLVGRELVVDIDKNVSSPEQVFQKLEQEFLPEKQALYPQFTLKRGGELEQTQESKSGLKTAFVVSLLGIYILLALPLKRYLQPLIIMSVIPFGMVGAILGHIWLDLTVSLYSFLAVLALSGVVVNDSLLIVSGYNNFRGTGTVVKQAIFKACHSRFRAIFLTTITTFFGLYPLLHETSEQAQYLIPAAAAMAYGLVFASFITLFLVPVLLIISNDIKAFLTDREWGKSTKLSSL